MLLDCEMFLTALHVVLIYRSLAFFLRLLALMDTRFKAKPWMSDITAVLPIQS